MKKCYHCGRRIKVLGVGPPGRQGTAGHGKPLGRVTLGHPVGCEVALAGKLLRPFEALPALMALCIATLRVLDDCSHSYLLVRSFAWVCVMAKDGEVACWFQASVGSSL